MNKTYYVDAISWGNHITVTVLSNNNADALSGASALVGKVYGPNYDVVRLWGAGKLLWTSEEGWLPEHESF